MILDFSTSVGHWPFRKHTRKTVPDLLTTMARHGVERAVVSSIHAIFYEDAHEGNRELAAELQNDPRLIGAAVLTPEIRAWPKQLEEAHEKLGFVALKLYPTYHAYDPLSAKALDLAKSAATRGMPLILQMRIEDRRRHHPKMQVDDLPLDVVRAFLDRVQEGKIVVAGVLQNEALALKDILTGREGVWIDLSFCESMGGINQLVDALGPDRLLFASHFPFLYTKAALLKIETAQLSQADKAAIYGRNAETVLGQNGAAS